MSVIILRKPDKENDGKTRYQLPCPNCGCEFQFNREDINRYEHTYGEKSMIKCPCCGEPIEFFSDCCAKNDNNRMRKGGKIPL